MSLVELASLIPPPAVPTNVGSFDNWRAVETALKITFPSDFLELVFTYGSGELGRFYWVWNPFDGSDYVKRVREICEYDRDSQKQFPSRFPYPIFPESPGYLPWGSDDNGNYYGWYTDGPSDRWPVLSHEVRGEGYRLHSTTVTEYFVGVFTNEIKPLAGDYPSAEDRIFRPLD